MNSKIINRITFILSIIGILIASYVSYTWLTRSPIVCITGGCETVRKNPYAWPLGIPFPLFGWFGYLGIAIFSYLKATQPEKASLFNKWLIGLPSFGVLLVTYFTLLETFVIKGYCMWCLFSTLNMYLIFFLNLKNVCCKKIKIN